MPSDAAPDRRPEPEQATAEQYRQRAVLLADLGRYDEAIGELASGAALAPQDAPLLVTLARVRLAADQPAEALSAAEAAVTADPGAVDPQVARGMALLDLGRFGEAAQVGGELLRARPDDPYALLSGAAIVGESRNGQESLNAAWRSVQLAPEDARGHLVLAVVTARMRLFDLAERAYKEAIRLDPALAEVQDDVGVVRLEQRRQVRALGELADAAIVPVTPPPGSSPPTERPGTDRPDTDRLGTDRPGADRPGTDRPGADRLGGRLGADRPGADRSGTDRPGAGRTADAGADAPAAGRRSDDRRGVPTAAVQALVRYGAGYSLGAAGVSALFAAADSGASRVWAALVGLGAIAVLWVLARRIPGPVGQALRTLRRQDRWLAVAGYATFAAPVPLLAYAVVGGPWPLVLAIAVASAAELVVVTRRPGG